MTTKGEPQPVDSRMCSHPQNRRGDLRIGGTAEYTYMTVTNAFGRQLGCANLEFCDDCGVVMLAANQVRKPKLRTR